MNSAPWQLLSVIIAGWTRRAHTELTHAVQTLLAVHVTEPLKLERIADELAY